MKLCRCPICHSDIHLDQLLEDDAGRELLGLIAQCQAEVARPLVAYIGLFRPEKSQLSNSRAVKLIKEVFELFPSSLLLAHALSETVRAVQDKRRHNQNRAALTNHNYLKQVYDTNAPKFVSVTAQAATENTAQAAQQAQAQQQQTDRMNSILVVEQLHQFGQPIKHLKAYPEWLAWKHQQEALNGRKAK